MLRWARERAGYSAASLTKRFPKLLAWEEGEVQPTLEQLERFAKATHVAVGFLFLPEPPEESIPIPDFRRVAGAEAASPGPNLLDTISPSRSSDGLWECLPDDLSPGRQRPHRGQESA